MNKRIFLLSSALLLSACTDNGFLFRSSGDYSESSGNYETFKGLDDDFKTPVKVERLNMIESDGQAQKEAVMENVSEVQEQTIQSANRVVEDLDNTATTSIKAINAATETQLTATQNVPQTLSQPVSQIESYAQEGYTIQIGSFSQVENAQRLKDKLSSMGTVFIKEFQVNGTTYHRVRLGTFANRAEAENMLDKLHTMGYVDAKVVYEP